MRSPHRRASAATASPNRSTLGSPVGVVTAEQLLVYPQDSVVFRGQRTISIRVTSFISASPHFPAASAQRNFRVPRRVVWSSGSCEASSHAVRSMALLPPSPVIATTRAVGPTKPRASSRNDQTSRASPSLALSFLAYFATLPNSSRR